MNMGSIEEEEKTLEFSWKIDYLSLIKKKGEMLLSPPFKKKSFDEVYWCLEFYPAGDCKSVDNYASLFLRRGEDKAAPFAIECDYNIVLFGVYFNTIKFEKGTQKFYKGSCRGWRSSRTLKEILFATGTGLLTVCCKLCRNNPENIFYSQNYFLSPKISRHSFQWFVKNEISTIRQEVIKFPCSGSSQVEIDIRILEENVEIIITMGENLSNSQFAFFNFILLDVEGKGRHTRGATHVFEKAETWSFPNFIKTSELNAEREVYIKDGCFTLQCDFNDNIAEETGKKKDFQLTHESTSSIVNTFALLSEDIKRMYTEKIHADIKLKAVNEVFLAHKSILCVRSPVFLAMFDNDMAESQKGEVDIPDMDAETVGLLLDYIYTGSVNDLDYENSIKLIVAADKYQVLSLKNKCADILTSMLSDTNVCEILVTADLVQHDTLKASVVNYIKMQPEKIFKSTEWKHCVKINVSLAVETASEVAILLGNQAKG